MKQWLLLVIGLASSAAGLSSQGKRVIVVQPFKLAAGVELPYDIKLLQTQLVADLKVQIGKEFDFAVEPPEAPQGSLYTLDGEITGGVQAMLPNAWLSVWVLARSDGHPLCGYRQLWPEGHRPDGHDTYELLLSRCWVRRDAGASDRAKDRRAAQGR
jgi:hypothetical protein